MSAEFLLDEHLAATQLDVITKRQQFAKDQYRAHDFDPETATIIGGSAFALAGIDARIEVESDDHPFDLDVMAPQYEIVRLYREKSGIFLPEEKYRYGYCNQRIPHVDAFSRIYSKTRAFEPANVMDGSSVIDGCRVASPLLALELRLDMPIRRGKAVLGVIKAHASAHRQGLEVATDERWRQLVADACRIARNRPPSEHVLWFDQLDRSEHGVTAHPAFRFMAE